MLPFCGEKIKKRIELLLKKYSLPTEIPDRDKLLPYIIHDKKNTDKGIIVVFSEEIGTFEFKNMTADEIIGLI